MKSNQKYWNGLLLVAGFCIGQRTFAEDAGPAVGIVAAWTIQNPTVNKEGNSTQVDGKKSFGLGITGEMVLQPGLGLEADLLLLRHNFNQDTTDLFGTKVTSSFSSGYMQIPVLIRYRPIPLINLGAGLYYSKVITSWSVSAPGYSDVSTDYGKDDWGFVAAVGSMIPLGDIFSITVDLRYTRSLTSTSRSSGDALTFAEFQALAGLRIGIR